MIINIINQKEGSASGTSGQIKESSSQNVSTRTPVIREFVPFKTPEDTKNLILGSSITARVTTETMPSDTIIHSHRGNSTEKKMKVLTKYPRSEFKCVIIPDGTNSIFKRKFETLNEFSIKFEELIEVLVQQFTPETVVICELPPSLDNVEANKNMDLYKEYNNCTYGSKSGYQVLKVLALIKCNNNWSFLFWDNIHLNDERGVRF